MEVNGVKVEANGMEVVEASGRVAVEVNGMEEVEIGAAAVGTMDMGGGNHAHRRRQIQMK